MENYVRISLETHLFFSRIMKEHALFLEAGFLRKDSAWMLEAASFRRAFEGLLRQTVEISDRMISRCVVNSGELVTPFTLEAERQTQALTGIMIDSRITRMEHQLPWGRIGRVTPEMQRQIRQLNERALCLLDGLIRFKERLLEEVRECRMFTANYPLLIEHILREARLYRDTVRELESSPMAVSLVSLQETESFWNQIMMEHALFIRGLLDPSEEQLIAAANGFAEDFRELLETARERQATQRRTADSRLAAESLEETRRLRDFKAAGTRGLLECEIEGLLLPLLADHVLREANHYIRILECGYKVE